MIDAPDGGTLDDLYTYPTGVLATLPSLPLLRVLRSLRCYLLKFEY